MVPSPFGRGLLSWSPLPLGEGFCHGPLSLWERVRVRAVFWKTYFSA